MNELELIREIYDYNDVARRAYLKVIWKLPERERYKDRGASFPSLADVFLHVLDAYRFWFVKVYRGKEFVEFPLGVRMTEKEVWSEEKKVYLRVHSVLRSLKPSDLDRKLKGVEGGSLTVRTMLLHMIEEELQHRGEMNALLWQMDIDPPICGFGEHE